MAVLACAIAVTGCVAERRDRPHATPPAYNAPAAVAAGEPAAVDGSAADPAASGPSPGAATLRLTETQVGSFTLGSAKLAQVLPALESTLGKPTETATIPCTGRPAKLHMVRWQGLTLTFDTGVAGTPLMWWRVKTATRPAALTLDAGKSWTTTFQALQAAGGDLPDLTGDALVGQHWGYTFPSIDPKPTDQSIGVIGGTFTPCGE